MSGVTRPPATIVSVAKLHEHIFQIHQIAILAAIESRAAGGSLKPSEAVEISERVDLIVKLLEGLSGQRS